MRYLFMPEVFGLLERAGFRCETALEFITDREPGFETWTAVSVARLLP